MKNYFDESEHVDNILNIPSKDIQIWNFAKENNYTIITNVEDFLNFSIQYGYPPKFILIKTGNQSNHYLNEIMVSKYDIITRFISEDNYGILEIY